jgi:hypothetical protein
MSRLVTFGCSVTYGHGLADCFEPENNRAGSLPSKTAWPNILGEKINKEVINKSIPGASNLEILYQILNFDFLPDDLVITLWTYPSRDMIFQEPTLLLPMPYHPVGSWKTDDLSKNWMKTHSDYDLSIRSWYNMHHAETYLNLCQLFNFNFSVNINHIKAQKPKYLKYNNLYLDELDDLLLHDYDRALDKAHPGPIAQLKLAEFMLTNYIGNQNVAKYVHYRK